MSVAWHTHSSPPLSRYSACLLHSWHARPLFSSGMPAPARGGGARRRAAVAAPTRHRVTTIWHFIDLQRALQCKVHREHLDGRVCGEQHAQEQRELNKEQDATRQLHANHLLQDQALLEASLAEDRLVAQVGPWWHGERETKTASCALGSRHSTFGALIVHDIVRTCL